MKNDIETCRQCRHKNASHHCTHERTQDNNGEPSLARHVWYVSFNKHGAYCAGKFFAPTATPYPAST